MHKIIINIIVVLSISMVMIITIHQAHAEELRIGIIPTESLPMGCGIQFWDKKWGSSNKNILIDKDLSSEWLKIVINNKLETFPNSKKISKIKKKNDYTVGDSFMEEYKAKGIRIILHYKIVKVCPVNNPDCESTDYEGEITIQTQSGKKIHYYLNGNGGC